MQVDLAATAVSGVRIRCGRGRAVFDCPGDFRGLAPPLRAAAAGRPAARPSCSQVVRCIEMNLMGRYADGSAGGFVASPC